MVHLFFSFFLNSESDALVEEDICFLAKRCAGVVLHHPQDRLVFCVVLYSGCWVNGATAKKRERTLFNGCVSLFPFSFLD